MDQGQHRKKSGVSSHQPFFTTGAGTNSDDVNNFESENNLNLNNESIDWRFSRENDPRSVGNKVIDASDRFGNTPENTTETSSQPSEVSLETTLDQKLMPPGGESDQTTSDESSIADELSDDVQIRTTEVLSKESVRHIDAAISELQKTGQIDVFYDKIRDDMEENLENSYGRKLAA